MPYNTKTRKGAFREVLAMDAGSIGRMIYGSQEDKNRRKRDAYNVLGVAVAAMRGEPGARSVLARAIDGTAYRAAWDLGDRTEDEIAYLVARECGETLESLGESSEAIDRAIKGAAKPEGKQLDLI